MFQFSNNELFNEVQELEKKYKSISKDLWYVKYEFRTCDTTNVEKINFLKNKMDLYEQEEASLKAKLDHKKAILEADRKQEFFDYVSHLDTNQLFPVSLNVKTDTVALMDAYIESKKDFLVLENQFIMDDSFISLLITEKVKDLEVNFTKISFIDLKVNANKEIKDILSLNLRPLLNACKQEMNADLVVFEKPFLIQGQVSANRSDSGSRWCCGVSNDDGSIYGDVTEFFIAGFKVTK